MGRSLGSTAWGGGQRRKAQLSRHSAHMAAASLPHSPAAAACLAHFSRAASLVLQGCPGTHCPPPHPTHQTPTSLLCSRKLSALRLRAARKRSLKARRARAGRSPALGT